MRIAQAPSYIPFRALTAKIAKEEQVSADTAAARAVATPAPIDERDGKPRIELLRQLCNPTHFDELQPRGRVKPTYDLAAYLARRCVQAYLPVEQTRKLVTAEGGIDFQPFGRFSDAAFGYRRGRTVVIAFRGTSGVWNALRQWPLTNLRAFPVRQPRRHLGFQMAWERLRPDMVEWIERTLGRDGELVLTGHSLGGAIAILAAFELAEDYQVRAVVTIGAPRVGLTEFRDQYLKRPSGPVVIDGSAPVLGEVTRRITHADDFVSRVPPGPFYRHVGEESRLDAKGTLVPGESRSAFERLFAGLDASVGWCYQRLDANRTTPLLGPAPNYFGANIQGGLRDRIPFADESTKPQRPLGRLAKDAMRMQQRFPYLSMMTVTGLQWTLIGVGAVVSCSIFVVSVFDLSSHRSKLYIDAFLRRYPVVAAPLNLALWGEFVKLALGEDVKREIEERRQE